MSKFNYYCPNCGYEFELDHAPYDTLKVNNAYLYECSRCHVGYMDVVPIEIDEDDE